MKSKLSDYPKNVEWTKAVKPFRDMGLFYIDANDAVLNWSSHDRTTAALFIQTNLVKKVKDK